MNYLPDQVDVLCNDCGAKALAGEPFTLDYAWNPKRKPTQGDTAVLLAPALHHARTDKLSIAKTMKCEGCGITVYVAPSSQWLLDLKAKIEQ